MRFLRPTPGFRGRAIE